MLPNLSRLALTSGKESSLQGRSAFRAVVEDPYLFYDVVFHGAAFENVCDRVLVLLDVYPLKSTTKRNLLERALSVAKLPADPDEDFLPGIGNTLERLEQWFRHFADRHWGKHLSLCHHDAMAPAASIFVFRQLVEWMNENYMDHLVESTCIPFKHAVNGRPVLEILQATPLHWALLHQRHDMVSALIDLSLTKAPLTTATAQLRIYNPPNCTLQEASHGTVEVTAPELGLVLVKSVICYNTNKFKGTLQAVRNRAHWELQAQGEESDEEWMECI